jgi:hypothetical protein
VTTRPIFHHNGNSRRFWSNVSAQKVLGYAPEDDSQARFAEKLGRILEYQRASAT